MSLLKKCLYPEGQRTFSAINFLKGLCHIMVTMNSATKVVISATDVFKRHEGAASTAVVCATKARKNDRRALRVATSRAGAVVSFVYNRKQW